MSAAFAKSHTPIVALIVVALLSPVVMGQQNPSGRLPVTSVAKPYLLLIRDPVVHGELELDAEQRAAVAALCDQLDRDLWSMRNKSAQQMDATVRTATATAKTRLASILSRRQQQRLAQIELRTLGTKVFLRDDLPGELQLSATQLREVRAALQTTQRSISDLAERIRAGQSDESFAETGRALWVKGQNEVAGLLTEEQRTQWGSLLGKPIDISKLGYVKFKAPELRGDGDWINSPPLTLKRLKGKVVAVHFYAFACSNCKRNFPWYRGWQQSFAGRDFAVVGIHTPEIAAERDPANVRSAARNAGLTFPILVDRDKDNWDAWGNSMWPSVYLIDRAGYVRSWWYGELNWQGAEGEQQLRQRIEQLLDASDADALTPGLRHQAMTRERRMDAVAGPIFRRRRFDALVEHRLEWHERQVEFIR